MYDSRILIAGRATKGARMQIKYFSTAWNDIKSSPGWFGRLCLLALVGLIPIFGQIVLLGYAFGWARDIAWKLQTPMPARIFGNEDGRLYSRGFFVLVIMFVCSLIPYLAQEIWLNCAGNGVGTATGAAFGTTASGVTISLFGSLFTLALSFICSLFSYAGTIRSTVYCRFSPGFQVKRLWAMIRHDTHGLVRIWAMSLLLIVIVVAVMYIALFVIVAVCGIGVLALGGSGAAAVSGSASIASGVSDSAAMASIVIACLLVLVALYFFMVGFTFISVIQARAIGYWVSQFDVPAWRGEEDPMPFELAGPRV